MTDNEQNIEVRLTEEDSDTVVIITGEVDPHTAPLVARHLDDALADGGDRVVIDLAGVTFIDSSGLRLLIGAQNRIEDAAGSRSLLLRSPSAAVQRLLEVTGLTERVHVE